MKILLALLLVGATSIAWTDYQPNQVAERKMLLFTASWCGPCKILKSTTLKDARVIKASENYLCVIVDVDKYKTAMADYKIKALPSIVFITDGKETGRTAGVVSARQLLRKM